MGDMGRTDLFCPVSSTYYISQSWIQAHIFAAVQLPRRLQDPLNQYVSVIETRCENLVSQTG